MRFVVLLTSGIAGRHCTLRFAVSQMAMFFLMLDSKFPRTIGKHRQTIYIITCFSAYLSSACFTSTRRLSNHVYHDDASFYLCTRAQHFPRTILKSYGFRDGKKILRNNNGTITIFYSQRPVK